MNQIIVNAMKHRFNYLSIFAALLLSSCDKVEAEIEPGMAVPFSFSVQISNAAPADETKSTKGVIHKTAFLNGEQIALFLTKGDAVTEDTKYFKRSVYQLALDGNKQQTWSAVNGAPALSLYTQEANLYALYPADAAFTMPTPTEPAAVPTLIPSHLETADMGDLITYTLSTGGVPVDETIVKISPQEIDYLAGKSAAALKPTSPSTTIEMYHVMAMAAIHLQRDFSYLGPGLLTEFTICNTPNGVKPLKSGTVTLPDRMFVPGSAEVQYHRSFVNHNLDDHVGWLLYPATCPIGSLTFSLTIDGERYDMTNEKEIVFEKGKLTVLELTVKSNKLFINNSILVNDWPAIVTEHEFELE